MKSRIARVGAGIAALVALALCASADVVLNNGSIMAWFADQTPPAMWGAIVSALVFVPLGWIGARTWVRQQNQPFEGWVLKLINARGEQEYLEEISIDEMKKYLRDPHQRRLFLKSHAANLNFFLNKDIIHTGEKNGWTTVDREAKKIVHDLSKYPQPPKREPATAPITMEQLNAALKYMLPEIANAVIAALDARQNPEA